MENCLVTTLKGSIDNTAIRKLEYLYFNVDFTGLIVVKRKMGVASVDAQHSIKVYENDTTSLGTFTNLAGYYLTGSENAKVISFSNRMYISRLYEGQAFEPWRTPDIFEQLSFCINLTEFQPVTANHTIVYSGMMDTYAGQFDNGRRSGELVTTLKVPINGTTIQSPTAVFGENDVKVYNTDKSTLLATYNGTGWSYPT